MQEDRKSAGIFKIQCQWNGVLAWYATYVCWPVDVLTPGMEVIFTLTSSRYTPGDKNSVPPMTVSSSLVLSSRIAVS